MNVKTSPAISARFLLFLLLLLIAGFRIVQLDADPPSDFSWSGGYFADEGFWSHNARNAVLFDKAVLDEWDARVVSPVFALLQQAIFKAFGVGYKQVRLIGIFSALLMALASFQLFKKHWNSSISFLLCLPVLLSFPMLVLARQGILDPFAAALAWCSLALLLTESASAVFLAGMFIVASCITKYLMIYTFVPVAFALLWYKRRLSVLIFLAGAWSALMIWLIGNYLPHRDLLAAYSRYYSSQQSWQFEAVLRNIVLQPFFLYFVKTPVILFFGNAALWYFLTGRRDSNRIEKICWIWLLAGILFFALWRYRPMRYYTSLLLPISTLAGVGVMRFNDFAGAFRNRPLFWFGILMPVLQMKFVLLDRWFGWGIVPAQLGIDTLDACLFLTFTLIAVLIAFYSQQKVKWATVLFFCGFLVCDMRHYLNWMLNPQYTAAEISQDLQQRVGNGVLTGQWAPELCLQNRVRAVPVWYGFVNSHRPFEKYGITHVLAWRYALGGEKFEEWYPKEFTRFHPVHTYRIKDSDLVLYEREK